MITLNVWRRTPDGDRLRAGQIRVAAPDPTRGGRLQGEFRYDPGYLEQPQALALALDPIHLPLKSGIFAADRPHAIDGGDTHGGGQIAIAGTAHRALGEFGKSQFGICLLC